MLDAYLYNGLRTPFGRHAGALARMRPDDMLAAVISEVVKQSPFAPENIEDVVVGCANQAGEDSRCVGRHAGLLAGLPIEVAGSVLQRNCGSGLNAIVMAAQAVTCGEGDVFVAGGVESMSRAPYVMNKAESAFGRDGRVFELDDRRPLPEPEDRAAVRRRYDAGDRRQPRPRLPDHARGLRCLRRVLAAEICRRQGRRLLRRRDSPRSRRRAAVPAPSRSPRTSIPGRKPISRHSRNCAHCRRAASPPPATPPGSTMAPWR